MRRDEIADLAAFVVVAEERSFTKAAARLGMAQSALSQIVRRIEERLGLRLLSRTTRSVAPTDAGERLLATLGPMLHDLDSAIASLSELRDRPSGTIRITTVEHAAKTILVPAMKRLLTGNPDIAVPTIAIGMSARRKHNCLPRRLGRTNPSSVRRRLPSRLPCYQLQRRSPSVIRLASLSRELHPCQQPPPAGAVSG